MLINNSDNADVTNGSLQATGNASVHQSDYQLWYAVVAGLPLTALITWTAVGNLLVFVAMSKYRTLRTITNYLILNMAISDFLLAVTVLPFSISNDLFGFWSFGGVLCKTWLAIDVLYCTASIWNIVAVAFDRFTATTFPIWYRERRSHVMAMVYITVVWTWSTLISVPPMMTNEQFNSTYVYEQHTGRHQCILYNQIEYVVFSSLGSFIVPMVALVALYTNIFTVLQAKSLQFTKATKFCTLAPDSERSMFGNPRYDWSPADAELSTILPSEGRLERHVTDGAGSRRSNVQETSVCLINDQCAQLENASRKTAHFENSLAAASLVPDSGSELATAHAQAHAHACNSSMRKKTRQNSWKRFAKREREATKRVTVVVIAFVVCWTPFMVMYMYRGFTYSDVNEHLQKFVIWLGYANSALNPCLYIWQNREFRRALIRIHRTHRRFFACSFPS